MNEQKYLPRDIEPRAQAYWEKLGLYQATDKKTDPEKDLYVLDMFPYPSGEGLHVGHVEGYTATDIYSRYKRMNGFNVLHPMGWDAFGLPAENTAIKLKTHPRKLVEKNVARFKSQLKRMGFSYDWLREINTTDPEYYKWTQWIFLKLYHLGLAYEAVVPINWCPSCKTGLANEEVVGGRCERCKTEVIKKDMRQWMLRITKYSERLLDGLDGLDWPEGIKELQRNWIGKSYGAQVVFKGQGNPDVGVYTTRIDTIFSGTYVILAPEHPFVEQNKARIENWEEVEKYRTATKSVAEIERTAKERIATGVPLKGISVINPATGETIPVWIADFVLAHYGTGAVFADAHDQRDFDLAKKYNIPLKVSIRPAGDADFSKIEKLEECFEGEGILINSEQFNGLTSAEARPKIIAWLMEKGLAKSETNYKLRDWVFSRQRYWGEPIPVVHCESCGSAQAIVKINLNFRKQDVWDRIIANKKTIETRALNPDEPDRYFGNVVVGDLMRFTNKLNGETRIFRVKKVYKFSGVEELFQQKELHKKAFSKEFSSVAELESSYGDLSPDYAERIRTNGLIAWEIEQEKVTAVIPVPEDQLPVLLPEVENYEPTGTGESPLAGITDWVNTTCPKCGAPAKRETNTMPQWAGSCWYFLRFADPADQTLGFEWQKMERWLPVNLYVGGAEHAVLHLLYARFWIKALYDGGYLPFEEPFGALRNQGMIQGPDGQKMSKSRGNVINPDEVVEQYGADALRLFEMFLGPFEQNKPWDDHAINGVSRFLYRIWRLEMSEESSADVKKALNKLIKKVGEDIESMKFNTAISAMMEFVNLIEKEGIAKDDFIKFIIVLAPFAPHLAEELWQQAQAKPFENNLSVTAQKWPEFDATMLRDDTTNIVIQVNGKVRGAMEVKKDLPDEEVQKLAASQEAIKKWLEGKEIVKVISVKGRLVSFVVR